MGVGLRNGREGRVENRDKTEEILNLKGFERNLSNFFLNGKNIPFTILT